MWFNHHAIRFSLIVGLFTGGLFVGTATFAPHNANAQDVVLSQLYGKGVHAYFDGDFEAAHRHLSDAIDGGTLDPRVYYFRAMAYHHLGRPEEAALDMAMGARLEIRDVNQFYPVSRSLERVQGRERVMLEQQRRDARLNQHQKAQSQRRKRFGGEGVTPPRPTAPRSLPPSDDADAAPVDEDVTVDDSSDDFKAEGNPFGDDPVEDTATDAATDTLEEDADDGNIFAGDDDTDDTTEDDSNLDEDDGDLGEDEEGLSDDEGDIFAGDDDSDEASDDEAGLEDDGDIFDADEDSSDELGDDELGEDDLGDADLGDDENVSVASAETAAEAPKLGKNGAKAIGRSILGLFGGAKKTPPAAGPPENPHANDDTETADFGEDLESDEGLDSADDLDGESDDTFGEEVDDSLDEDGDLGDEDLDDIDLEEGDLGDEDLDEDLGDEDLLDDE